MRQVDLPGLTTTEKESEKGILELTSCQLRVRQHFEKLGINFDHVLARERQQSRVLPLLPRPLEELPRELRSQRRQDLPHKLLFGLLFSVGEVPVGEVRHNLDVIRAEPVEGAHSQLSIAGRLHVAHICSLEVRLLQRHHLLHEVERAALVRRQEDLI